MLVLSFLVVNNKIPSITKRFEDMIENQLYSSYNYVNMVSLF